MTNAPATQRLRLDARAPTERTVPFSINGASRAVPTNVWLDADEALIAAVAASDRTFQLETQPSADPLADAAAGGGGGSAGASTPAVSEQPDPPQEGDDKQNDGFDADAIIAGTVEEVAERLAGLTPEQLDAVAAAEIDREKPRKGVAEAVEAAKAALIPNQEPPTND